MRGGGEGVRVVIEGGEGSDGSDGSEGVRGGW